MRLHNNATPALFGLLCSQQLPTQQLYITNYNVFKLNINYDYDCSSSGGGGGGKQVESTYLAYVCLGGKKLFCKK